MPDHPASFLDRLKSWPLVLLPHQLLSRAVRVVTRWRATWFKNALINGFIQLFDVDMADAVAPDAGSYSSFNDFFTRPLKPSARPAPEGPDEIISPVDGRVSQAGDISGDRLLQAKGRDYTLEALLGGNANHVAQFANGSFATLYLSPRDYHRIHMPCPGRLLETTYIPGRLFSVAPHTVRALPGLFTRNERLVCLFETPLGPMALIMVGAIFVSCMETVWGGVANPRMGLKLEQTRFEQSGVQSVTLDRGDEMGRFNMGSTVILLFAENRMHWSEVLQTGSPVRLGQVIGQPTRR